MIVLDTDVVSALMRRELDAVVVAWLDRQPLDAIWTSSITIFEIRFGLALLPPGRRRSHLEDSFARVLREGFEGRILPFDEGAANRPGEEAARRQTSGRRVDFRDVEIAGIVGANDAILATRNTRHFDGLGIKLVNPWQNAP
jgi:toxin FitB